MQTILGCVGHMMSPVDTAHIKRAIRGKQGHAGLVNADDGGVAQTRTSQSLVLQVCIFKNHLTDVLQSPVSVSEPRQYLDRM